MAVRMLSEAQAAQEVLGLLKTCSNVSLAVAWATKGGVADALLASGKLKRAVVGTHMYITDPKVLRRFSEHQDVSVIPPSHPRLFHPKVYIFEKGSQAWAIVGSHNLTRRAFGLPHRAGAPSNIEASVLIEGRVDDQPIKDLLAFVDTSWAEGEKPDEDFLFSYELQYQANRRHLEALKTFRRISWPKGAGQEPSPMTLSWAEFVRETRTAGRDDFEQRMALLDSAQRIFGAKRSFSEMGATERKAIAGTFGTKEEQLDGLEWGWFGRMFSQGDFKHLVNQKPQLLSGALDHIPAQGDVTEQQYRAFVEDYRTAFADSSHKGGYPVASRLLAMKRPDQFVAVNSKNRRELCGALNVAHSTLDLDNFWERIVERIRLSPWWLAPRPRYASEARLWDFRAAMLDCLYYEGEED